MCPGRTAVTLWAATASGNCPSFFLCNVAEKPIQRHKLDCHVVQDMQQALVEKLEAFGLSSKEAHLYAILLKYGPKTTGELAKLLHSYRVDIYRLLETLTEKGICLLYTSD